MTYLLYFLLQNPPLRPLQALSSNLALEAVRAPGWLYRFANHDESWLSLQVLPLFVHEYVHGVAIRDQSHPLLVHEYVHEYVQVLPLLVHEYVHRVAVIGAAAYAAVSTLTAKITNQNKLSTNRTIEIAPIRDRQPLAV